MFEIVLSSSVTKLVPVPKSGTVREAIAPLLARQKLSFETVDIKSAASLQVQRVLDTVLSVSCTIPKASSLVFNGLQLNTICYQLYRICGCVVIRLETL